MDCHTRSEIHLKGAIEFVYYEFVIVFGAKATAGWLIELLKGKIMKIIPDC